MKTSALNFRINSAGKHVFCISMGIVTALLLHNGIGMPALASASSVIFRFALPGGAAILFNKTSNPQAPLAERAWRRALFIFPNGATFSLLPRVDTLSVAESTEIEPPNENAISPSDQYVSIRRVELGMVSSGPGQAESVLSREYCSMIEIRTGCITSEQIGEICGAGWRAGQGAQWGTDDQTSLMLKDDHPLASRLLHFIAAGQPSRSLVNDASGTDNLLRCDLPSAVSRDAYRRIAIALHAAGADNDAQVTIAAISKADSGINGTSAPASLDTGRHIAIVSSQRATLYTAPDDAHARRKYLVRSDSMTVLKQSPADWSLVDYVNVFGDHLIRWMKSDQLAIEP